MGWTILYIAFGLVALWLLGEVLFQNKAPLRWRLLALCGFLGVVTGVLLPSVIVIALGGIAFAVGQTYVTLSVRRGYMDGWTIGGRPKPNRRRRARSSRGPAAGPNLQVSGLTEETPEAVAGSGTEPAAGAHDGAYDGAHDGAYDGAHDGAYDGVGAPDPYQPLPDPVGPGEPPAATPDFAPASAFADAPTVYAPQPLPDETGAYGVYSRDSRPDPLAAASYDVFGNATAEGDPNAHGYGGGYSAPPGQGEYTDPYPAYDDGAYHGGQAPYSDPYIGTQQYAAHYDPYEEPDAFGGAPYQAGQYDGLGGQPAQQYGQEYYHPQTPQTPQNPLDDAWVPQQRDTGHAAEHPSYPPPQPGYDEQRYHY